MPVLSYVGKNSNPFYRSGHLSSPMPMSKPMKEPAEPAGVETREEELIKEAQGKDATKPVATDVSTTRIQGLVSKAMRGKGVRGYGIEGRNDLMTR